VAKRQPRKKKHGLERLPLYKRPLRPKEKVDLPLYTLVKKLDDLDDILDTFDEEQLERTQRWRKTENERASESERRRKKNTEES